jgi:sensor histidine kinase YesM
MVPAVMISIDLIAICLLTFGIYFRRHRRADLVVAFIGVNVGVLAVASVLGTTSVGVGVGLGLFGVLSIIRLRSSEISQTEVAYYFAALALGLLAGLATTISPVVIALMALVVIALVITDSPRVFRRYRQQTIQLDTAFTDEAKLKFALAEMLNARIHGVTVVHLDMVNDTTLVSVRYQVLEHATSSAESVEAERVEQEHAALVEANR